METVLISPGKELDRPDTLCIHFIAVYFYFKSINK